MRRHYANYLKGFPNMKEFRLQLVSGKSGAEVEDALSRILEFYQDASPRPAFRPESLQSPVAL
jgi:hypothetical protein